MRNQKRNPGIAKMAEVWRDDPLRFGKALWPDVDFYDRQREIIASVQRNDETFVYACNMSGKDFVSGFLALWYFTCHGPVRIVTTSVRDDHLRVLWGEIGRFIETSRFPLLVKDGGPLLFNHRELKKVLPNGRVDRISYCIGMVSEKGEGMAGHHAKYTMGIIDEASGVDNLVYTQMCTWAKRILAIGNPNPCQNFFRKGIKGGDLIASSQYVDAQFT